MTGVAVMAEEHDIGAQAPSGAPCYRLTDKRTGDEYEIGADDLVRIVGVELPFIDWAIRVDGQFENGRWRVASV